MPRKPLTFDISDNFTMSAIRGRAMSAAFRYWPPINNLHHEVEGLMRLSSLDIEIPANIKHLCIEIRYTDRNGFDESDSVYEDARETIYRPCVHFDGRGLAEGIPDNERYWTLWSSCIDALAYVADRFSSPPGVVSALENERLHAPRGPFWPPIPKLPEDGIAGDPSVGTSRGGKSLASEPGELWVHLYDLGEEASQIVVSALCTRVSKRALGKWTGDSHGTSSSDVSFDVSDLNVAGKEIDEYLRSQWPDLSFQISDQFEPD